MFVNWNKNKFSKLNPHRATDATARIGIPGIVPDQAGPLTDAAPVGARDTAVSSKESAQLI